MAKILISPGKYVQGAGELKKIGSYAATYGKKALVLISAGGKKRSGEMVCASFAEAGIAMEFAIHSGECSKTEIKRLQGIMTELGCDMVVGIGGGKIFDTAKAVAYYEKAPVLICPTIASTDAPCSALSAPMILQNAPAFQAALEKIQQTFQQRKCYFREESACLLKALLIRLSRAALLTDATGDAMADRLIRYIQEHCCEALTVEKIAAHFNYHAGHINRVMRRSTGTTIHSYVIRCRMDAAKTLLLSTDMTVSQVAEAVGIGSEAYFCNSFKKMTGISPKEYRRRAKNQ